MRKAILFGMVFMLCMSLTGCTYSSANLMRAQGKDIMVFGAWGYVHCIDSAVTFYRSTDATGEKKDDYPRLPTRPTITEAGEASTVNIGRPNNKLPIVIPTPQADNSVPVVGTFK